MLSKNLDIKTWYPSNLVYTFYLTAAGRDITFRLGTKKLSN